MISFFATLLVYFSLLFEHSTSWVLTSTRMSIKGKGSSIANGLRMDVETPPFPAVHLPFVFDNRRRPSFQEKVKLQRKLPWSCSIRDESMPCTYMPFWAWQLNYFDEHLTNFRELPLPDESLSLVQTSSTRVMTKWYASDEYRLIRMTYMDAGNQTQIFTSVCYPRANLPILGNGLLQCGERRITISDFQPLEESHSRYEDLLLTIREQFPSLNQPMSERFFENGKFWSNSTLLGRFPVSSDLIWQDLWPAYKSCVQTHVQLCKTESKNIISENTLLQRHAEYDTHVASRDPAISMLKSIFGADVARDVVYKALFPMARPSKEV
jgi:15,16-dihydrobiliverdin:ferredoxin oxidoreductase